MSATSKGSYLVIYSHYVTIRQWVLSRMTAGPAHGDVVYDSPRIMNMAIDSFLIWQIYSLAKANFYISFESTGEKGRERHWFGNDIKVWPSFLSFFPPFYFKVSYLNMCCLLSFIKVKSFRTQLCSFENLSENRRSSWKPVFGCPSKFLVRFNFMYS